MDSDQEDIYIKEYCEFLENSVENKCPSGVDSIHIIYDHYNEELIILEPNLRKHTIKTLLQMALEVIDDKY